MKLSCIIIEDEPLAMEKLEDFIKEVPALIHKGSFDNAIHAMDFLRNNETDLVFLDMQMPKFSGIQFLESFTNRPDVIIVSAYDQYALKGYEFNVTDYLLKPYSFERFMQAIDKVFNKREKMYNAEKPNKLKVEDEVLFVKSGTKIEKIELRNILLVQGMKDYQMIITENSKLMTLQTFKEIEHVLPEPDFVRIHKSYIVALRKIESIERNRIKIGDKHIPISDTYKEHFYQLIREGNSLI